MLNLNINYIVNSYEEGVVLKKNSFLYGTFVLIIVNFIVRFLGFAYKIILSRMIGPEAIGIFHLVFPILMVLITFTSAGIPVAVSKLVAHFASLNNKAGCKKVLGISIVVGFVISAFLSIFLYANAQFIAERLIKNKDIYPSLIALIPAVPLITLSSIMRGYYYGIKNVGPSGTSQILEQLFRITFVIGVLLLLPPLLPKYASVIAVLGISVGELTGLLWLLIRFGDFKTSYIRKTYLQFKNPSSDILEKILYISIPITITRMISVVMQSINAALIPQRLMHAGLSMKEAVSIFGKLTGMAMPLLFLPFIVTSALVVNIIPSVAEEVALKNWHQLSLKSNLAIRMTLLVSIPITALLVFFASPICNFLYPQADVGEYLSLLGYGTIFLSLQHVLSGILHGIGKQIITTVNYLCGMLLQILCTYYLVPHPQFGVKGFILGFILSTVTICLLNYISLNHYIKLNPRILNDIGKPIFSTTIMILLLLNLYQLLLKFDVASNTAMIMSVLSSILSYVIAIFSTGCINYRTLQFIIRKK